MDRQLTQRGIGQLAGLGAAVTFGASAPLTGAFAHGASPVLVAGLLYGGAAIVLAPPAVLRVVRGAARLPSRQDLPVLGAITVLGGMVAPTLLVVGLERSSTSVASLLLNLEAVATAVVGAVVFREHVGRRCWTALCLVVLGGAVLVGAPHGGIDLLGAASIAAACICWGVDNNLSRRLSLQDVGVTSAIKAAGAAVPMLLLAQLVPTSGGAPSVVGLLVVGAVGYGASIGLDLVALRELGAAREAVLFATAPFVGASIGVALGEPLGAAGVVAAVLMAAAVVLLLREDHGHVHRHEPVEHEHWHRHDDGHHDHDHVAEVPVVSGRGARHLHTHTHRDRVHAHPHAPDAHHRHSH